MTFLPIVERELRVRARLKSTYRFRLYAAIGAIALVGLLLMASTNLVAASRWGGMLFLLLSGVAFIYCLLEGARTTADCLSEEKRSGTLGLLFLTDLRPYDVVLGKLMATSLNSFYGLLAIFPPLAIPLVIGGVTVGEFWRCVLVLMNTLFFSLSVGMAVSSASRDARRAWSATLLILVGFAAIAVPWFWSPAWVDGWIASASPATSFATMSDAAYSTSSGAFWRSFRNVHLLGWLSLIAATFILPRSWQDQPAGQTGWKRFLPGSRPPRLEPNSPTRLLLLEMNPVGWLVTRGTSQYQSWLWGLVTIAGIVAVAVWVTAVTSQSAGPVRSSLGLFGIIVLIHLTLALWLASEACQAFSEARDSGAFELLLCTPVTAGQIVEGYARGLQRRYRHPLAVLLFLDCALLAGYLYAFQPGLLVSFGVVIVAALWMAGAVMDLVAVSRYGLWQGLANQKASKAVTKTVVHVLILPTVGVLLCSFGTFWPVVAVIKNLIFINYAKEQMRRQFRLLIAGRYGWAEEAEYVQGVGQAPPRNPLPSVLRRNARGGGD